MRVQLLPLLGSSIGTVRHITALHFGNESAARKIYIQASLHADELPGALTAFHLRQLLLTLEQNNQINAHIVLVPLANPIGLGQSLHFASHGRFDFASGQNFNRLAGLNLYPLVAAQLKQDNVQLGEQSGLNKQLIRQTMAQVLKQYTPQTELESMHLTLLSMAHDADVVLDLHCDVSAVLHMYTLPELWPVFEPLACYLGSECQLLAHDSGVAPFDEALSTVWSKLQNDYPQADIPLACASTTVELRGQADLSHDLASSDAQAIVHYLSHSGDVQLPEDSKVNLPALKRAPHPLSGAKYIVAPQSGVVVYQVSAGHWVQNDELIAQIIDPVQGTSLEVRSDVSGLVYARNDMRFAQKGDTLVSISGVQDLGHGAHLSP